MQTLNTPLHGLHLNLRHLPGLASDIQPMPSDQNSIHSWVVSHCLLNNISNSILSSLVLNNGNSKRIIPTMAPHPLDHLQVLHLQVVPGHQQGGQHCRRAVCVEDCSG
eukprot:TRINITY_DN10032_c0_g1_i1.p1 TRINITY_DN10032_c0_g1~~TRINITY_DN10032_c0_g1_i1.p1  ORF type:complete len:108 (+),score=14.80 TRINITY_DN10032_c0_g1_i1:90-413(+)